MHTSLNWCETKTLSKKDEYNTSLIQKKSEGAQSYMDTDKKTK